MAKPPEERWLHHQKNGKNLLFSGGSGGDQLIQKLSLWPNPRLSSNLPDFEGSHFFLPLRGVEIIAVLENGPDLRLSLNTLPLSLSRLIPTEKV